MTNGVAEGYSIATQVKVQVVLPTRAESPVGYTHRVVINDAAFLRNIDLTGT